MKKVSILDLREDLLEDGLGKVIAKTQSNQLTASISLSKKPNGQVAIEGLLKEVAQSLDIDTQELSEWIKDHSIPTEVLQTILRTAKRFKLNPLLSHIAWEFNNENRWEVYIPIDGWIALIHKEPTFQGITFDQATETENGVPIWMECTIYRADLHQPLTVREYFAELKTNHPMWMQMPRRVLRHKTLQQCARLAFGISVPELRTPFALCSTQKLLAAHPSHCPPNRKEILRQKMR